MRIGIVLALTWSLLASLPASGEPDRAVQPAYARECGSCHFAYQPWLLPERSWRRIMNDLRDHFGESAEVTAPAQAQILNYLVNAPMPASRAFRYSEAVLSVPQADTPIRVTLVPYIAGIHGGVLDPLRQGRPAVRSLAECGACHPSAERGDFAHRQYTVSDELFRSAR